MKLTKIFILIINVLWTCNFVHAQCDPDLDPPLAVCDGLIEVNLDSNGEAVLQAEVLDDGSFDWCSSVEFRIAMLQGTSLPNEIPNSTEVTLNCCHLGTNFAALWIIDESGNSAVCWSEISLVDKDDHCLSEPFDCSQKYIRGNVFFDNNQNCQLDAESATGTGKTVVATVLPERNWHFDGVVAVDGSYEIVLPFDDDYDYEIEILDYPIQVLPCGNKFIKSVPNGSDELIQDFAIRFVEGCAFMAADVSAPILRRCFDNSVYISTSNYSD